MWMMTSRTFKLWKKNNELDVRPLWHSLVGTYNYYVKKYIIISITEYHKNEAESQSEHN